MRGRSSRLRIALTCAGCAAIPLAALGFAACSSSPPPAGPTLTIAPSIVVPQDLIGQIASFQLVAYVATGISCDATTGALTGNVAGATPLFSPVKEVSILGCGDGDTRCMTTPAMAQSSTPRIFWVTGYADVAQTMLIAQGCASVTLTPGDASNSISFPITMESTAPAQLCGDNTIEPPETCDPPTTTDGGICGPMCQTIEELLSVGSGSVSGGSLTVTGSPGDKSDPSFVWTAGTSENFLAFFGDTSVGASQVSLRVMSPGLTAASGLGSVLDSESIYMPNTLPSSGIFPPQPTSPHNLKQPAAVQNAGITYVAFADDTNSTGTGDTFAVDLRSFDAMLNAQQGSACVISTATNGSATSPAIGLSFVANTTDPLLYVAWQDDGGNIYGRVYTPNSSGGCGATGTQELLSTGSNNGHVSIAGIPSGWVTTWASGSDIVVRAVGTSGTPSSGMPTAIELAGHEGFAPTIASIPGTGEVSKSNIGAFAVAWQDQAPGSAGTTIFAQRYNSKGDSIDIATQISETTNPGGELTPFLAASPTAGGAYVVAWVDGPSSSGSQVRGRFLSATSGMLAAGDSGSSAFLPNAAGNTNEFQVSVASGRTRVTPTVAVGGGLSGVLGGAPFVAFGWADNTTTAPYGITARRFPSPL